MVTETIINGCINNDRKCQRQLYEFCFPIMMKVSKRYTINEDEAVETMNASFLKILKNLPQLKDLQTLPAWVKRISVNTAIDFYRTRKKYHEKQSLTLDNEYSPLQYTAMHFDDVQSKLQSEEIYKLIATLPATTLQVLNLFAFDGYSHKEIAEMLDLSEEASRWHLHRARKMMTEMLTNYNDLKYNAHYESK